MMRKNISQFLLLISFAFPGLLGCNKWDDHNALTDAAVGKDLFQQVKENPALTRFADLLTKSGFGEVIASSKTFTVFAPTDAALASLDPSVVNDSAKLRAFVSNHIANQSYQTAIGAPSQRLQMLNGKYNNFAGNKFDEATIVEGDKYGKNGVLHIIDKMVPALPNAWEFLETSSLAPAKQRDYMRSLFRNVFDVTNAVQTGVEPLTGRPIYKQGTDSVRTNLFWRDVYDLRDEKGQYTLFLLTDAAWDSEVNKFKPFFVTGSPDSTSDLSKAAVVRDLAVEALYLPGTIPDTILSRFNAKVGIEKSAIVQAIKTSNGMVYLMNKISVLPRHKFQQYIIQAENYNTTSLDRRGNTYFRDRYNPLTAKDFRDVLVFNHGVALFNLGYRISGVPAAKYRAYWVALHDNINGITTTFTQKLGIGSPSSTALPYTTVALNNYNEVYLGEFTLAQYNSVLDVYLTAFNGTTAPQNTIVCDYIRIEPVL